MIRGFQQLWALARRFQFLGICAALSFVFAIGAAGLSVRLHRLSGIHKALETEASAMQATFRSKPQLLEELDFVRQTVRRITDNLAKDESRIANSNYFYDMADECEVRLALSPFNTPPPDTGVDYVRIPFGLRASGTYSQLAAFIHAVETGPRISNITSFSFQRVAGSPLLTVDFNVDLLGKR
jgi:Tfp pilus assembly protein PilO